MKFLRVLLALGFTSLLFAGAARAADEKKDDSKGCSDCCKEKCPTEKKEEKKP